MKIWFVMLLSLIPFIVRGQQAAEDVYDTARRRDPDFSGLEELKRNSSFSRCTDSAMLFFQQYDRIKRENTAIQSLGDVSTPFINLRYSPFTSQGFIAGINPFANIYYTKDSAHFYQSKLPYTEFYYTQGKGGQNGMIWFDALHTQNFGKQFNITAKYHSTSNSGFYKRQSGTDKNLQLSTYYQSLNNRYLVLGVLSWNKTNMMVNGGLEQSPETDTFFRSLSPNVRIVDVALNNARNINRLREYSITQVLWLKRKNNGDSMGKQKNQLGISHNITVFRQSNYYTDDGGDYKFYDSIYYNHPDYSADSTGSAQYSNLFELFTPLKTNGIGFRAGLQYDNFSYYQETDDKNYFRFNNHNISVKGNLDFSFLGMFRSEAGLQYFFEGYNLNDYYANWMNRAFLDKRKKWLITAGLSASSRHPFFQQLKMKSNHYEWNNNFKNSSSRSLSFTIENGISKPSVYNAFYYTLPRTSALIDVRYFMIDNNIYYGRNGLPAQGSKAENCFQVFAVKHLNLKRFQLHQELVYQIFSKELGSQLQLPEWLSKSSIYYQGFAFKKASFIQVGFDANITSSYKARFYNPATLNFQQSDKSVGAYPYLDFFINAEIKTARIFFKVEHFNQDLAGVYAYPNYMYASPFQPSAPRRFRIGFVWKFYY